MLISVLRLANQREVMGQHVNGRIYNIVASATAIIVSLLSLAYLTNTLLGLFGLGLAS